MTTTRPPNYTSAHPRTDQRALLRDAGQLPNCPQRSTTKRRKYSNSLLRIKDLCKAHQPPRTDAPQTFRTANHWIPMSSTRSLSAKQVQTPNHHSQNIVRGRPQSCRVSQIWTTTSWGSPPGHRLKAPSTGATGITTLQPRPPRLRGLLRAKATPETQQPNPRNSREIPSGQNLRWTHQRKRRRRRNPEEGWKTLSKSRTNCTRT